MSLIGIIIALVIVGAILYVVSLLPIDATIKKIIYVIAIIFIAIWLLTQLAGTNVGGITL